MITMFTNASISKNSESTYNILPSSVMEGMTGFGSQQLRRQVVWRLPVDVGEGCAVEALTSANVFVTDIKNALDLLCDEKRIIGTLRTKGN